MSEKTAVGAMTWFADVTFIQEQEWVRRISDECFKQGYIALIDWSEKLQCWVFHTLFPPDGTVSKKNIAADFEQSESRNNAERWLEERLCDLLTANNIWFGRQVGIDTGIADVVTNDAVIEVKKHLDRDTLFHAAGQALAYRNAIDPDRHAVILAHQISSDAMAIAQHLAASGIRIVIWDGNSDQSSEVFK